jgi:hypothetical protein
LHSGIHDSGQELPDIVESGSNGTTTSVQSEEVVITETKITSGNSDEASSDGDELSNEGFAAIFVEA